MLDDHTNQVNSYKRPEHDLLIVAQGERFFISQNGRKYASRRALTTTLCKIFDQAIDAGLSCLLRNAHPSLPFLEGEPNFEKGSPHIGFSRCANERWVFVIDQYSGGGSPQQVTVNFAYHKPLEKLNIKKEWETGGGQNYYLDLKHLPEFLKGLTFDFIDGVEATLNQNCAADKFFDAVGIVKEKPQLQDILISHCDGIFGTRFGFLGEEITVLSGGRLDILLSDRMNKGRKVVVELKHRRVGRKDIRQIEGYIESLEVSSPDEKYIGALVGKQIRPECLDIQNSNLSFYEYDDLNELKLIHKAGLDLFGN